MPSSPTTTTRPAWWNDRYDSAWDRVKGALRRDVEQTRHDLGLERAVDLHQDVGDTVKQGIGAEPIPPGKIPNMRDEDWEEGARYGYGAGLSQGHHEHAAWGERLETDLRRDWERMAPQRRWDDVRSHVKRGFEHARRHAGSAT